MTERLNYTKARQRDRRPARSTRISDGGERQHALQAFVEFYRVPCFRCDTEDGPWAKTGFRRTPQGREPWAICVECVNKRSAGEG